MLVEAIHAQTRNVLAFSDDDVHTPVIQKNTMKTSIPEEVPQHNGDFKEDDKGIVGLDSVDFERETDQSQSQSTMFARRLQFSVDKGTGRMAISVIDAKTEEIIREIPPEEILKIQEKIKKSNGLIFDRKM